MMLTLAMMTAVWISPAEAQIERYFRKSVSLFRIEIPADMTKHQGKIVYDALYDELNSIGRFDYNPIPLKPGISLEKLFEITKQYAEDHQVERAAAQFELIDEHYKEERITGETLDKIIAGSYIIIPRIVDFNVSRESGKETDKQGKDWFKHKVSVSYGLKVEVWNAQNIGSEEEPNWQPNMENSFTISGRGSESRTFEKKVRPAEIEEGMIDEAVSKSLFLLRLQLGKSLKSLDMFIIKASVTSADLRKDVVKFDFGRNVGLRVDDPFKVIFYEKKADGSKKKVEAVYMKVRKVLENESQAQALIVKNPYRVKAQEIVNPGDQVLEHPKMGLNITVKAGFSSLYIKPESDTVYMHYNDGWDDYYFESDQNAVDGVGTLVLGVEFDLAPYTGISELYLYEDNTLLLNAPLLGGLAELGVKRKFYMRQLAGYYGASLGVFGMTGYIGTVPTGNNTGADYMFQRQGDWSSEQIPAGTDVSMTGVSPGLNAVVGINYLFTPETALTIDAGYRLYPNITDLLWKVKAEEGSKSWELDLDEFEGKPPSAKIMGFWLAAGVVINL